jgi:hypothetical protein
VGEIGERGTGALIGERVLASGVAVVGTGSGNRRTVDAFQQ